MKLYRLTFIYIILLTFSFTGTVSFGKEKISIISSNYITITSPVFGDRWTAESTKDIEWEFSGVTDIKIELSLDDGSTWMEIVSSTSAATGSYNLTVPSTGSNQCKIRITDTINPDIFDISDTFEIIKPELQIEHTPITESLDNAEITFIAVVTSSSEISSVSLYYDITGRRIFDHELELIQQQGNDFYALLPVGVFTAMGMEYYLVASDINGNEARSPSNGGFYSIRARISDIISTEEIRGGDYQNAYRMISIPLDLVQTYIVDQMTGRLPPRDNIYDWRLFRFSPGSVTPQEYPDIEGFSPGRAFWLITSTDYRISAPEGTTVTTSDPFNMTLSPGWNDIANPWMFDISWDDMYNPSNANLDVLYTYEGVWSDPTNPPHTLEPWKGYTVRNMENRNVVINLQPIPVQVTEKHALIQEKEKWRLTIKAIAGGASDNANHLGVHEDAQVEWDRYDHLEPPPIGEYVSVNFPHHEWERYPNTYTVDFRPISSNDISWNFDVTTNISGEKVIIDFDGIETLPDEYGFEVIERDSGQIICVNDSRFSFVSEESTTERHFRINVYKSTIQENEPYESDIKPFVTAQCYPNPFNPQTTIRYELSNPGKVTISVFNVVGQHVKVYEIGYKDQGTHEFLFDASDLTSGIYFYHIDAGYSKTTGKVLYMR